MHGGRDRHLAGDAQAQAFFFDFDFCQAGFVQDCREFADPNLKPPVVAASRPVGRPRNVVAAGGATKPKRKGK